MEREMGSEEPKIELSLIAALRWDDRLKHEVVEVEPPPGGSFIALPGPKLRPVRPYLDPFAGPGGVAARVVRGDGQATRTVILIGDAVHFIETAAPPLAASAAHNGVWVLTPGALQFLDKSGKEIHTLQLSAVTLVGGNDGAVWAVGLDTAWSVDAGGQILARYPWKGGLQSVGSGGALCVLDKSKPRRLRYLYPDGEEKLAPLPFSPGPFEELLAVTSDTIITKSGAVLYFHNLATGAVVEITAQAAGLTNEDEAFVSGRTGPLVNLWIAPGRERRLTLPAATPDPGAFRAVAVIGSRTLIYGRDFAAWYENEHIENTFAVDEKSYRDEVFPFLWDLGAPRFAAAAPDGLVVISATGPKGVVLIGLRAKMKNE
jgi:hypothetical protein